MSQEGDQKVVVVTGAGRGIGRATALALAREGFALCLVSRSRDELLETRALAGLAPARSLIVLLDLAHEDAPDALMTAVLEHYGRIDVLVNQAGMAAPATTLTELSTADIDRLFAVNLRAPIAIGRMAAAMMTQTGGGTIVNVAACSAPRARSGQALCAAAKAGLLAFTRAASEELRAARIKVSAVVTAPTDAASSAPETAVDRAAMLAPEDVAAAVLRIVRAPADECPVELVLEPPRDPSRG
jgi:NAD(P)-dependent dehydrogenase (short-subunit alcohol dehydrogenase family)